MKWHELEALQAQDLDAKIALARAIIEQAFATAQRPALAFSGGKDSTVLLDLVRRNYPDRLPALPVIYGNTGVEYPECVHFARWLATAWRLDFHEARPGQTTEPGYRYAGQRRIWQHLIDTHRLQAVLKPDGKLISTLALERACPPALAAELAAERLVWPAGTLMSYWWCADQYGWPLLGKAWSRLEARRINIDTFLRFSQSQSTDPRLLAYYTVLRQVKISQHCCRVLKKEPSERVQAALGVDLIFKGLMASESRARAKNFLTRGHLFAGAARDYLHGQPFFHCQPLATWTDADIWAYIRRYQVPYAPLYDMTFVAADGTTQHIKRNGCLGCGTDFGFANNHLTVLRQTHRKAWQAVMRLGMAEQIRRRHLRPARPPRGRPPAPASPTRPGQQHHPPATGHDRHAGQTPNTRRKEETTMRNLTDEQIQLEAIRAELALHSTQEQAIVETLAQQLRDAIKRAPILLAAMSLVAAEVLAENPEE